MKRMKVYLAGCMSYYYDKNRPDLAEYWRDNASKILRGMDFEIFNPTINYNVNKNYNAKGVVYQNISYLNNCDIILLNLDDLEYSYGTIFEIYYYFLNHKPVIAFGNNTGIYYQPHINESISIKFNTLDEALEYIRMMYCQ